MSPIKITHNSNKSSILTGSVDLPLSKSESNRILMLNMLSNGVVRTTSLSDAHDTILLRKLLQKITDQKHTREIVSLDCEDAGTVARFLLAYVALSANSNFLIKGNERLTLRPMKDLTDTLTRMGTQIIFKGQHGFLPVLVKPPAYLEAEARIAADVSSQFVSALLMVAPTLPRGLKLSMEGTIVSKPYIEMTLAMLKKCGITYFRRQHVIEIKPQAYKPALLKPSADWSSAAFWYQLAALSKQTDLTLKNLNRLSLQGDSVLHHIFKKLGVVSSFTKNGAVLSKTPISNRSLEFDFIDNPDIFPSVVLTCAFLRVKAVFRGLRNLKHKESDRLKIVCNILHYYGVKTEYHASGDILHINPENLLVPQRNVWHSHNDHRIAMALASLSPAIPEITIENAGAITKSYPGFFEELQKCGCSIINIDT